MKYLSINSISLLKGTIVFFSIPVLTSLLMAGFPNFFTVILCILSCLICGGVGFTVVSEMPKSTVEDSFRKILADRYTSSLFFLFSGITVSIISATISHSFDSLFWAIVSAASILGGPLSFAYLWPRNVTHQQLPLFKIMETAIKENDYKISSFKPSDFELDQAEFSNESHVIEIKEDQLLLKNKFGGVEDKSSFWNWSLKYQVFRMLALTENKNYTLKQDFALAQIRESIKHKTYSLFKINDKRQTFSAMFNGPQLKIKITTSDTGASTSMTFIKDKDEEVDSSVLCNSKFYDKVYSLLVQKENYGTTIDTDSNSIDDLLGKALKTKLNSSRKES